jgi:hypothetical protein
MLTSCTSRSLNYGTIKNTEVGGKFIKINTDIITNEYEVEVTNGFSASIDFDIKEGKVDWEIINPKGTIIFAGNVINENGITYKQLTQSSTFLIGSLREKQEVKNETDSKGNIIIIPDFNYLQFESNSLSGVYKLNLKPIGCEGNYKVIWSDKLTRK